MRLGIGVGSGSSLALRLAWLTALRLCVLVVFFIILTTFYLGGLRVDSFSGRVALSAIAASFAASALYAAALRKGRGIAEMAYAQLITDQIIWTAIVYISGGASSGATSLYGLTCLSGAVLVGLRGAVASAVTAIAAFVCLCVGFIVGVIPPPPDQVAEVYALRWVDMRYPLFLNILAIVVVTVLSSYLAERLRATGGRLVVATERAEQAERLAAMGRLAAGLAHEIRNPLGSIAASIELLRTGGSLSAEDQALCEIVERETARLNDLVGDMLDLSRPRAPVVSPVDLGATTRDVVALAARSGRGVDVRVRYEGPDVAPILADAAQIRQVVWNLMRNAIQASSASDEVVARVSSAEGEAVLEIIDHGPGIPSEARERLFDAFFTTRSQGMGIGLAVVKRILDDHGFAIDVESGAQKGTIFRVKIPTSGVDAPSASPYADELPAAPQRASGSAR